MSKKYSNAFPCKFQTLTAFFSNTQKWIYSVLETNFTCACGSASARISKGQGYQGFSRKRAGSSFGQKGQFNLHRTGKNLKN
jgi:hypothetical protein